MDRRIATAVIHSAVMDCTSDDLVNVVYELVIKRGFSPKSVRNKCIYADFIRLYREEYLPGNDTIRGIHAELAAKYDCSQPNIRKILGR